LAGVTAVHFGDKPVNNMKVLSPFAIAAVVPAGTGTVDVTVTNGGGTSAKGDPDKYSYFEPQAVQGGPEISSVTPSNGPLSGGTLVKLRGSNLDGAYAVAFGGTPASQVTAVSATEARAVAPSTAFPTRVDISVTTPIGTSVPTLADGYTYGSPPPPIATTVSVSASPNPSTYGHEVTLTAEVAPTDGAGRVSFTADAAGTPIAGCGSVPLTLVGATYQASCSMSGLPVGGHEITAAYTGDASYAAATGATNLSVISGAGGGGAPGGGGADGVGGTGGPVAPRLTLGGATKQKFKGSLTISAKCSTPCSLSGLATVSASTASKVFRSKRVTRTLGADQRTKLKLKFAKKATRAIRRALARGKHLSALVTVTGRGVGANSSRKSSTKRKIKLAR
jgi:hypothetical protein